MDLMLGVYHDMDYFLSLEYEDCWRLIEKALERQRHDSYWLAYVTWLPHMEEEKRCTFDEFLNAGKRRVSTKSSEEIIREVEEMRRKYFDKPKK